MCQRQDRSYIELVANGPCRVVGSGCRGAGGDIIVVWVVRVRVHCGGVVGGWVGGVVDGEGVSLQEGFC